MKKEIDPETIVSAFETFCIKNDLAAKSQNNKLANRYAKKTINSYLQLKELGKVDRLSRLVNSENENVRLWAATHLLPIEQLSAKKVLQELAAKPGFNAFSADMTLKEREKGNLKLTYDGYNVKW